MYQDSCLKAANLLPMDEKDKGRKIFPPMLGLIKMRGARSLMSFAEESSPDYPI